MIAFKPTSRLGRWAVWFTVLGLLIFVANIIVQQSRGPVVNTNTGQELAGPIGNDSLALSLMYTIFGLLMLGGILAAVAIVKRDRAVLVWLAGFFGLIALMIFVGGFFVKV